MKKISLFLSALILNAYTITDLFNKVEKIEDTQIDTIFLKEIKEDKEIIKSYLMPKVSLNASYNHYSTPTNLRPLPPTESGKILKSNGPLPFSRNIFKIGVSISMPLFVKEIYDNKEKVSFILKANHLKSKLNLIKREALLIGFVSNFNYLIDLKHSLMKKRDSINKTLTALDKAVKLGVVPKFKEMVLKSKLIEIDSQIAQINSKIAEINSNIFKLTKVYLKNKINIKVFNFDKSDFIQAKIASYYIKASKKDYEAKKDTLLPKLFLVANGYRSFAKAYNNDKDIALNYGNIGVNLKWDIFDKKSKKEAEKSKLNILKANLEYQKILKDLKAEVIKINKTLNLIKKELLLTKKDIEIKEELLKGAKEAFLLNRLSVKEYLSYEDDLSFARAKLSLLIAKRDSLIANLALIYGKNLKKVFK